MNKAEMIAKLQSIREALQEGYDNCGGGDDNIFTEPLKACEELIRSLED